VIIKVTSFILLILITDVIMLTMSDIHVRRVAKGLLRDVNIGALKAGLTQREYVLEALAAAVGHGAGEEDRIDVKIQHPPLPEPTPELERHDCPNCGDSMVKNEKLRRWECAGCSFVGR